MDSRSERIAENELLFRQINDQIKSLDRAFGVGDGELQSFFCECGSGDCASRIQLTMAEYERLRIDPVTFAVVDGHEHPEIETVVERHDRYTMIRKNEGGPAEYVRALER